MRIAFARDVGVIATMFQLICPHMTDVYSALHHNITIQPYLQHFLLNSIKAIMADNISYVGP